MRIVFAGMVSSLSFLLCSCGLFESGSDVPPPPHGEEWTTKIRQSYPNWQPPQEMPAGRAAYEAALSAERKARTETVSSFGSEEEKEDAAAAQMKQTFEQEPRIHIVEQGDTLWALSKVFYGAGGRWTDIFEANKEKIKDPDKLTPGLELLIPPAGKE